MNGSHKCGFIWWGTAGCASRSTSVFLTNCGCNDLLNIPENFQVCVNGSHTHSQGIPEGYEDYPIICNMRNPYSKCVSSYLDILKGEPDLTFKDFIIDLIHEDKKMWDVDHYYINEWEKIGRRPDYFIRMEHMEEDLRNIPMLPKGDKFEEALSNIRENRFKNENPHDEYVGNFQKYQKYYDQEIADMVYDNHKEYFELGGYDKDSWKL